MQGKTVVRDEELQRLINYAKGLNLTVILKDGDGGEDAATWTLDNTEITVYKGSHRSKITIILTLIHEIGHALHNLWEKERKVDTVFYNAIEQIEKANAEKRTPHKKFRKIYFDNEVAGTKYWENIYRETDMKFPFWRIGAQKEIDMWPYEAYWRTGKMPSHTERTANKRIIMAKYKPNLEDWNKK